MCSKVIPLVTTVLILIVLPVIAEAEKTTYDKGFTITDAVDYCVNEVHTHKAKESYEQEYYLNFDAYYNPATSKVNNNATRNGDQPPLFIFQKCMTKVGFPLM